MTDMINVIVKNPGEPFELNRLANDFNLFRDIIGGFIETLPATDKDLILCDEDGLLKKLPYNISWRGHDLFGTIIFAGNGFKEFADVSDELLRLIPVMTEKEAGEENSDVLL